MTSTYMPSYHDFEVTFTESTNSKSSKATVHYIEAGNPKFPTILLLHGFPSSSFQYRDFIPMLSDSYQVLAPDYPAFGWTKVADDFVFNFDNITIVTAAWLKALDVEEATIFIQDFGAPVGLRLAVTGGLKLNAIISQNGNIYKEGLGPRTFGPLMKFWENYSEDFANMIADKMLTLADTREYIVKGTPEKDFHLIDPQIWELAYM